MAVSIAAVVGGLFSGLIAGANLAHEVPMWRLTTELQESGHVHSAVVIKVKHWTVGNLGNEYAFAPVVRLTDDHVDYIVDLDKYPTAKKGAYQVNQRMSLLFDPERPSQAVLASHFEADALARNVWRDVIVELLATLVIGIGLAGWIRTARKQTERA
ncbi:hypothetical protein AX769_03850 [Frondihabitans sp. PAMC 28766]|uniref:hypothetical protein n=1 Tax=Frondihabitans sp. PAMC 28766 TaxID=1795630 RepID=UPI00078C179B|nr:hypothetical protein [Frondihabitans sp. PAMC 28766]AMM19432.1 hypothetical protein AX769_03850 [Frondihabitans sp. PAMC 28766]